ncbi:MAG TPA: response regulator transcription factor [Vicinamibacterales bacterium]|jgi:two-component system KDP operon response regulator KdpE|nr:response regulator transcription factor [Vicinamibacterales bacterium]
MINASQSAGANHWDDSDPPAGRRPQLKIAKRVLVVEHDASLLPIIRDNLMSHGFYVECVADGAHAITMATRFSPNLMILDLRIPSMCGLEVCHAVSMQANRPAIIVLSAKQATDSKVRALNLGADDYVTMPFALDELLARVHAVLRRNGPSIDKIIVGEVTVDFRTRQAYKGKEQVHLRHREFDLLRYMAERRGKLVTRDELLRFVWGYEQALVTRSVDIAIARIRRKIEPDPHQPRYLGTVHGGGYVLIFEE